MKRILPLVFLVFVVFSCKKDFLRQPVVSTGEFDLTAAIAHGNLIDKGTKDIIDHGFCWDSVGEPNLGNNNVRLGSLTNTGSFQAQLQKLSPNRTYFLKAFISFNDEVLFGAMITFTTPDLPVIITTPMTEITETFARCGGEITADNGSPVLARGVCWGTSSNPDTTNNHTSDGTGTGVFASVLSGLSPNTQYYVRAYATSIYGTRYANEVEFNTGQSATTPFVSTFQVTNITQTTATSGGNVVADGGADVTVRGVCWSTTPYPTTEDSKTEDGSGTGVFTSSLIGLAANTTYYLRAYATNEVGTSYGNEVSFKTEQAPDLPTVITTTITNITQTSATSGGEVTADGGSPVTARGICWSIYANPTLSDSNTTNGSGLGSFVSQMDGLEEDTKYYVRAYATNNAGTSYGNENSFTTGQTTTSPTVITDDITNITQTTATSGGNVTSDGGASVTVRGVCWSTSQNPTTADNLTTDGSGIGTFTSSLTGLTAYTTYYVRAYATNSAGTSYGNQKEFTTLPDITVPTVSTAPVTNITTNSATSGGTVTDDGGAFVSARGVCWSTSQNPTLADPYTTDGTGTGSYVSQITGLSSNTTYYVRAYATNSAGTSYGNQQTFTTLQDPVLPTVTTDDATDITQTTATSGGNVVSDGGATVTVRGVCWSTSSNPTTADNHTTDGSGIGAFVSYLTGLTPNTYYYVRAYATNSVGTAYGNEITFTTLSNITLPTVTTDDATDITQTTATSGGNVTSDGGGTVTARGVCWSTSTNPTLSDNYTTDGSGLGAFVSYITGLTENTQYYVRAYATNSVGTAYGNEITFTTSSLGEPCPGIPTVLYEGQTYNTIQIGTQCWLKEDLNVGTMIPGSQNQTNNSQIEKYCYDNNPTNCTVYGGLYQWDEMMQYMTTEGVQGICPNGWHLPTDGEWTDLTTYLGGESVAGGKMKETGTVHWAPPNTGATNSSEFTGLPGGNRGTGGDFGSLTITNYIWSSTQYDAANTWYRTLHYINTTVFRGTLDKSNGFSVRCLLGTGVTTIPSVSTNPITNITQTTATSGGNVINDGGTTVTARGVCWSTSTNPTLSDNYTTDGSGLGAFVSNISGLTANTQYYVRAYATNSVGTAYGNEVSFTTLSTWSCGDPFTITHLVSGGVAPVDKTVTYGTVDNIPGEPSKCWITSNLGADHQATAVDDDTEASAGWYWQFNRKQGYKHDGTTRTPNTTWTQVNEDLNWETVNDPCAIEFGDGWRIPTYNEWLNVDASGNWTDWNDPWNSLLKMHAAGDLSSPSGSLQYRGSYGYYWSQTQSEPTVGWSFYFNSGNSQMDLGNKAFGFTIRCIKD